MVHSEKVGIGCHKENIISEDLCYICGKIGHPTIECPVANDIIKSITKLANGNRFIPVDNKNKSTSMLSR